MSLVSRRKLWALFEALYSQELTSTSKKADTPPWIKTPLLPHQRSALAAALALEKAKTEGLEVSEVVGDPTGGRLYASHGILGDRVGSGKSLTALALVKAPPPPSSYVEYITRTLSQGEGRDVGLLRHRDQIHTNVGQTLRPVNTSLFLVPHALISQWETYVSRDTTLKALFIKRKLDASSDTFMTTLETYDAIFVSSTMWATLKQTHPIRTLLWNRIFVDEADSISITTEWDELNARFYWFISASWLNLVFAAGAYFNIAATYTPPLDTPPSVIRRVAALQAGGQYLNIVGCRHMNIVRRMCGVSASGNSVSLNAAGLQSSRLILHSSEEYIQESFRSPEVHHTYISCSTPVNIRVLDQFISPDMLERLHAGDLTGALETIGMTAHSETEITAAVTDSLKKELDQARRVYEFKKTIEYSSESAKQKSLELCEQKLASLESRITAIEDRIKRSKEQTCPICFCDVTNPAVIPCCQQLFCFSCLCESLKRSASCPLCRARINDIKEIRVVGETNVIVPSDKASQLVNATEKLNKKDSFLRFVKTNPKAKILMFSGYDATFTGLERALELESISYATLNGSQARIDKLLREFGTGKYGTLFLNARNMGAGLNIETATHVVLFHKMSAELEKQIVGRALRLGRTAPLEVIHLVHDNEVGNQITHVAG
jgi:hypothetical protein